MPYQDFNTDSSNDMTPEEYVRLLAIQRRMLQNQGAATSRSQGNTSFPSQRQLQMQALLPQRMMQALQNMECQQQGDDGRDRQRFGNALRQSMPGNATNNDYSYCTGDRRSRHRSNLSRSFNSAALPSNNFGFSESSTYDGDIQGLSNPDGLGHILDSNDNAVSSRNFVANSRHSSFSRSWDPRFNDTADFDNRIMSASAPAIPAGMRFVGRSNDGGTINSNSIDTSSLFAPTRSDGGFCAQSTYNPGYLSSSPPANLPSNSSNMGIASNQFRPMSTGTGSGRVGPNSSLEYPQDNGIKASTAFPSTELQGKRRRLNSDELMLDMLSDFIPAGTGEMTGRGSGDRNNNNAENTNVGGPRCNSPTLSPFSRRTAACSPLTPLNHTQGYVDSNSPMGQTPIMFAEYFLGAREEEDEDGVTKRAVPPPPPLYQETVSTSGKHCADGGMQGVGGRQGVVGGFQNTMFRPQGGDCFPVPKFMFNEVQFDPAPAKVLDEEELLLQKFRTPFSSEPLCLPPRRKKDSTPKTKKRVATKKKPKEEVSASPAGTAINNDTTPSSAAIVALTAEIKSQMKSPPTATDDNECPSPNVPDCAADSSGTERDGFSIPQFATSMEASQYSQQTIHDWDKKFGLRRAHSKTMRESARSRKKVLEFLKGEGASLWKSATAAGLADSTNFASATLVSSWSSVSSNSMMFQEQDNRSEDVKREHVANGSEGLEDEQSEVPKEQQADEVIHDPCDLSIKEEAIEDCSNQENARAISSLNENEDDEKSVESIGSFSHEYEEGRDEKEHLSKDFHEEFISSYSSKMLDFDIEDEELTNMFRRASLDHCTRRPSLDHCHQRSSSIFIPLPGETHRRQSFAKSA
ncbi:hypothetical protein HJC23_012275 [Cyclotella cryptica]|uniref:Uncharacterized protein n=1 Tax=Cyclotella cryptica TaxID=29204 RepID=A0ABD3P9Q3_9STRA|eukprot:CCRYP_016801-RA/>CCRYP_016801-RA protein AED:0.01 eAED:0.01 QI:502/1/1/1/1/1/2/625/860